MGIRQKNDGKKYGMKDWGKPYNWLFINIINWRYRMHAHRGMGCD